MKIKCVFVCLLAELVWSGVVREEAAEAAEAAEADSFTLDIVHYNDFHARFEETSLLEPVCKTDDARCVGGFARLYHAVQDVLARRPGALLLDAGDDFQGTYWYTLLKENVTHTFINMLPNDAHTLGNHEFDDGVEGLVPYLRALRDPVLAANLELSAEPALRPLVAPRLVLQRRGRRIGIIGVTTPDTPILSNPGRVKFLDPVAAVRQQARLLTEQGVDIVVVLSHCGLPLDKEIARTAGENIDIIVGGHTHSLLWNEPVAPSGERPQGAYPELVPARHRPGHQVVVVTASAYSKYLGHVAVEFDSAGEMLSFRAEPVFLNRTIPEDPKIKSLLEPYAASLHAAVRAVVGVAAGALPAACAAECALGDLVADSFRDHANELKPNATTVSIVPAVMIRSGIGQGNITRGDIINAQPFSNKVISLRIKGKHLISVIEDLLDVEPKPSTYLPQIAGWRLTLNTTSARVDEALVKEGDDFVPLDENKTYQLITYKFVMDKLSESLRQRAEEAACVGTDRDILEAHIKRVTPITPALDNRLVINT